MNTNKLLNSIRITASIPNDDSRFSDEILLTYATEEIASTIMPLVISTQEEYFIQTEDIVPVNDQVSIPKYAYMSKLRDVKGINGSTERDLAKFQIDEVNKRNGFWVEGRKIKLTPDLDLDSLRVSYYAKHNDLVVLQDTAPISSVNSDLNQVAVSVVPSTITAGSYVDIVDEDSGEVIKRRVFVSNIASSTITLSDVEDVEVGNYLVPNGETSILNLPDAVASLLTQAVANRVYEDIGDSTAYQMGMNKYNARANQALKILETRIRSKPPIMVRQRIRRR